MWARLGICLTGIWLTFKITDPPLNYTKVNSSALLVKNPYKFLLGKHFVSLTTIRNSKSPMCGSFWVARLKQQGQQVEQFSWWVSAWSGAHEVQQRLLNGKLLLSHGQELAVKATFSQIRILLSDCSLAVAAYKTAVTRTLNWTIVEPGQCSDSPCFSCVWQLSFFQKLFW